jgi:hypothetical protein
MSVMPGHVLTITQTKYFLRPSVGLEQSLSPRSPQCGSEVSVTM